MTLRVINRQLITVQETGLASVAHFDHDHPDANQLCLIFDTPHGLKHGGFSGYARPNGHVDA